MFAAKQREASWAPQLELLAAALLRDTLEDTDATLAELEQRFGPSNPINVGVAWPPPQDAPAVANTSTIMFLSTFRSIGLGQ